MDSYEYLEIRMSNKLEPPGYDRLRKVNLSERQLDVCPPSSELLFTGVLIVVYDAVKKAGENPKLLRKLHGEAVERLAEKLMAGKLPFYGWEAAEAFRDLDHREEFGIGENAMNALKWANGKMELMSISQLSSFVEVGMVNKPKEEIAQAVSLLSDHLDRGHFRYNDTEYFHILLLKLLKDERDEEVLCETAGALEKLGDPEAHPHIMKALEEKGRRITGNVKRRLLHAMVECRPKPSTGEPSMKIKLPTVGRGSSEPPVVLAKERR